MHLYQETRISQLLFRSKRVNETSCIERTPLFRNSICLTDQATAALTTVSFLIDTRTVRMDSDTGIS